MLNEKTLNFSWFGGGLSSLRLSRARGVGGRGTRIGSANVSQSRTGSYLVRILEAAESKIWSLAP